MWVGLTQSVEELNGTEGCPSLKKRAAAADALPA